jgi:hypothetical protein
MTAREPQEIGYAVVADATSCTFVIARAMRELFTRNGHDRLYGRFFRPHDPL